MKTLTNRKQLFDIAKNPKMTWETFKRFWWAPTHVNIKDLATGEQRDIKCWEDCADEVDEQLVKECFRLVVEKSKENTITIGKTVATICISFNNHW